MSSKRKPEPPAADLPPALRTDLTDEADALIVAMTEAVLAAGLGFKGPFEEFGPTIEGLVLNALGAARRDGAQLARANADANAQWLDRLALLYSDGSISVADPGRSLAQLRQDAIDSDDHEDRREHFTRVARVRVEVIEEVATPSAEPGNSSAERFARGTYKPPQAKAPAATEWKEATIHGGAVLPNGQTAATLAWPFKEALAIPSRIKIARA